MYLSLDRPLEYLAESVVNLLSLKSRDESISSPANPETFICEMYWFEMFKSVNIDNPEKL